MTDKKKLQLGMNPSTASHRLLKDILWSLLVKTEQDTCCKCGEKMTRETFSIEHVVPWLDSEDPVGLFFDVNNIGFSHLACNVKDARRKRRDPMECGNPFKYVDEKCRCVLCKEAWNNYKRENYCSEKRSERYKRTGN